MSLAKFLGCVLALSKHNVQYRVFLVLHVGLTHANQGWVLQF